MMRRPAAAAIAVLVLALSGCGSREVPLGSGVAPPAGSTVTPATADDTVETPGDVADAIESVRRGAAPDAGGRGDGASTGVDYGKMGPAEFNTMPLKVTLSASCATPGQTMRATAETLPGSKLAFVAAYSDNDFVPNFTYVPGETNPTGTFTWAWEITPTTPRGNAMVNVVSSKGKKGASFKAPFRVADSC